MFPAGNTGIKMKKLDLSGMVLAPEAYTEILKAAINRGRRVSFKSVKNRDMLFRYKLVAKKRIDTVTSYITRRLKRIYITTPFINDLHPFYKELIKVTICLDEFKISLALIKRSVEIILKISEEQKNKISKAQSVEEIRRYEKQFIARTSSVLKKLDKYLKSLRKYQIALSKLPDIDPYIDTIVVAGPPNVGKSSFIRYVSRAKPEVREYPFTTKNLVLGHIEKGDKKIQIIDTPGLLDRPISKRNRIELRAIFALKYLARVIVFILDPSETCGYPITYQINVLKEISVSFKEVPMIVALNKIDVADEEKISYVKNLLEKLRLGNVIEVNEISVKEGINVHETLEKAIRMIGARLMLTR